MSRVAEQYAHDTAWLGGEQYQRPCSRCGQVDDHADHCPELAALIREEQAYERGDR